MSEYIIAVVGLGKIGLPLAAQFVHSGQRVIGCDINPDVVSGVNAGISHVKEEPELEERIRDAAASGLLTATTDTSSAVSKSNVVVIIVPVMVDDVNYKVDFRSIDAATRAVAKGLKAGTLVIYETTLPVGTTRTRFAPLLEEGSGLQAGRDFYLAFSPERVYSGRIFSDLKRYPKVVGGLTRECTQHANNFYATVLEGASTLTMQDADTSEFVKLIETTYRDVNIALANEFARFAQVRGLAIDEAIFAANSQPYSHILRPGIAVGGHCIPVYPYFLINDAGENEMSIPSTARRVNDAMSRWALDLASASLGGLEGKRILILGLAYRENVKETAFSGAVRLIAELKEAGAIPLLNDPLYTNEEIEHFGAKAVALDDLPEGDGVILQAYHDDYRALDWRTLANKGYKVLLDGRNSLDRAEIKSAGMQYIGMGR